MKNDINEQKLVSIKDISKYIYYKDRNCIKQNYINGARKYLRRSNFVAIQLIENRFLLVVTAKNEISYDIRVLKNDTFKEIIRDALNDKIVVGENLIETFSFLYQYETDWQPSCSIDLKILSIVLDLPPVLISYANPLKHFLAIAGIDDDFDSAFEQIFGINLCDHPYMDAVEFLICGLSRGLGGRSLKTFDFDIVPSANGRFRSAVKNYPFPVDCNDFNGLHIVIVRKVLDAMKILHLNNRQKFCRADQ